MENMRSPYREPGTLALSPPLAGTVCCICRISAEGSKMPRPIALQNRVRSAAVLISAPAESEVALQVLLQVGMAGLRRGRRGGGSGSGGGAGRGGGSQADGDPSAYVHEHHTADEASR